MIKLRGNSGFTLIELVLTITILGILSVGFIGFITLGTNVYTNISSRDVLVSDARFAIERLTREIRHSLPNSIRTSDTVTSNCLEYVPIKTAHIYTEIAIIGDSATDKINVIQPSNSYIYQSGDRAVVYSTAANDAYNIGRNKAANISSVNQSAGAGIWQITLDTPGTFADDSPNERLYIVGTPVSYCLIKSSGQLYRYANYGFSNSQPSLSGGVLMAENISNGIQAPFEFNSDGINSGIVQVNLTFSKNFETVEFSNGVHIKNVP